MDPDAPQEPTPGLEPGFHLCVSRLLPYKNVDAVVAAFEHLPDERLVVVGDGPGPAGAGAGAAGQRRAAERPDRRPAPLAVRRTAGPWSPPPTRTSASRPSRPRSFGRPTIALRWGGFLDTVEPEPLRPVLRPADGRPRSRRRSRTACPTSGTPQAIKAHAATFNAATLPGPGARGRAGAARRLRLAPAALSSRPPPATDPGARRRGSWWWSSCPARWSWSSWSRC